MSYIDYTDKSTGLAHWLSDIAPKYFDFDAEELYRASQFGYMNEIMATVENDTHHSVSISRREFYPTTAKYLKSFYKMAALQGISYPMANPAIATALLIIKEEDIITYGAQAPNTALGNTDTYTFVLDNTMKIMAGSIPFMFDYPIIITAKKSENVFRSGNAITTTKYAYTVRYDVSSSNSLNNQHSKYIKSRVYRHNGETLLLIKIAVRQCTKERFSASINKSPILNNVSLDFTFNGDMCNFESFYTEAYSDISYQLEKLPVNSNAKNTKFCMWQMVDQHTLRLSFPANAYFNPKYNSTIDVDLYTTLGEDGNFAQYDGPLVCIADSEKYPYNNLVTVTGKISGSAIGGYSYPSLDDFKSDVVAAYATNKTYTTDQDLQYMFDSVMMDTRNRVIFSKRRDDVFERLYGAYVLIKDLRGYIIHTNSITGEIIEDDIKTIGTESGMSIIIRPGTVWRYHTTDPVTVVTDVYETDDDGNPVFDEDGNPKLIYLWETDSDGNFILDDDGNKIPIYERDETTWEVDSAGNYILDENGNRVHPLIHDENGNHVQAHETTEIVTYPDGRDYIVDSEMRKYMIYPTRIQLNTFYDDNNDYYYTNPFLIRVNRERNVVAFYQNTFDTTVPMDLLDVNNESFVQFNMTGLNVYRNSLAGENFYKFSIAIQPSIADSNLSSIIMVTPEAYKSSIQDVDNQFDLVIRAFTDGIVETFLYVPGAVTESYQEQQRRPGSVYMILKYKTDMDPDQIQRQVHDSSLIEYLKEYLRRYYDDEETITREAYKLIPIRISGGVEYYSNSTGARVFKYNPWYGTNLRAGDTFKAGSIIAYANPIDTGALRVIMEFKDEEGVNGNYYIPLTLESYDATNDSYNYVAYISTSDNITDKDMLLIDDGFFDAKGNAVQTLTINPSKCKVRVSTFFQYDDVTEEHSANTSNGTIYNYAYCQSHTFTNSYENTEGNEFNLLKPFTFIRSVMNYQEGGVSDPTPEDPYATAWMITLREIPLIRASWMRNSGNVLDLFSILTRNHDYIEQAYDLLENNFTIDMKLYNTYGRSRYFDIGLTVNSGETITPLDSVNVKFRFGAKVSALTDWSDFKNRFVEFVRNYIESFNEIENLGQNIHIMDLITQININFADEIEHLEYYGINEFDSSIAQIIKTWSIEDINALGYNKYIPEFINLYAESSMNDFIPTVELKQLS